MAFLASKKVIHRDLAARNILVETNGDKSFSGRHRMCTIFMKQPKISFFDDNKIIYELMQKIIIKTTRRNNEMQDKKIEIKKRQFDLDERYSQAPEFVKQVRNHEENARASEAERQGFLQDVMTTKRD